MKWNTGDLAGFALSHKTLVRMGAPRAKRSRHGIVMGLLWRDSVPRMLRSAKAVRC